MGKLNGTTCARTAISFNVSEAANAAADLTAAADDLAPPLRDLTADERLQIQLTEFLQDREGWPSHLEFLNAGRGDLLRAMDQLGGRRTWWVRLGKRPVGGLVDMTVEDVEQVLRHYLNGRADWPSAKELYEARVTNLMTLKHLGLGQGAWRERLGYAEQHRVQGTWTTDMIRRELAAFLGDRTDWPTQREFRDTGRKGLLDAIYNYGGATYWADQFGMTPRPHGRDDQRIEKPRSSRTWRPRWTDERIRTALTELLDGRDSWPTTAEFRALGLGSLLNVIYTQGRADYWAAEFGLEPPSARRRSPGRSKQPSAA